MEVKLRAHRADNGDIVVLMVFDGIVEIEFVRFHRDAAKWPFPAGFMERKEDCHVSR